MRQLPSFLIAAAVLIPLSAGTVSQNLYLNNTSKLPLTVSFSYSSTNGFVPSKTYLNAPGNKTVTVAPGQKATIEATIEGDNKKIMDDNGFFRFYMQDSKKRQFWYIQPGLVTYAIDAPILSPDKIKLEGDWLVVSESPFEK